MRQLRRDHPYEFFTRGTTIKANVETVKRRRWEYEPRFGNFSIPGAVQDWLDVNFEEEVSFFKNGAPFGRHIEPAIRGSSVSI